MNRKTVRDLIVDAADESRLVNRAQPIPGNLFNSALILLKKRLAQYSNTSLLSFVRREIEFDVKNKVTTIGEYELTDEWEKDVNFFFADTFEKLPDANTIEDKNSMAYIRSNAGIPGGTGVPMMCRIMGVGTPVGPRYVWIGVSEDPKEWNGWLNYPDVEANNLQEVVRCYIKQKNSTRWEELSFVAYEDLYSFGDALHIFSVLPERDNLVKLILPKAYENGYVVKVIYNESYEIDEDTVFTIPNQYIALFTAGLVYDLACQFPRLSDNTVQMLKDRLTELEENVRRSSAVNKFIARDLTRDNFTMADFIAGRHIGV